MGEAHAYSLVGTKSKIINKSIHIRLRVMMTKFLIFPFAIGCLLSFHAFATVPSKMDVIQCGVDAGDRQGDARSAFVEGCLTVKYAARQENSVSGQSQVKANAHCSEHAGKKQGAAKKAFIEGCMKAKQDARQNFKTSPSAR